jgi:RimJ/RimL family protein N-acetyltransferase
MIDEAATTRHAAQPTLRGPTLVLRPFALGDARDVQRLAGDHAIADTTLNIPHPYPDGAAERWIATSEALYAHGEEARFAVTTPDGTLVGSVGLRIAPQHRHAELGYWVGRPYWGRGYATEAAHLVVHYGFERRDLHRIIARHLTRNPASGRIMRKLGMRHEGCDREHVIKWGRFEDLDRYGLLRAEYVRPVWLG